MRWALRKDHLFLAAQHADNAANAAAMISEESEDRADTAVAATEMKALAQDMKEAAKQGRVKEPNIERDKKKVKTLNKSVFS